jgi:hypothetical protein
MAQELFQLTVLAVGQCVHRIDDNRLNAFPGTAMQHVIDDRHNVGEALA